MDKAVRDPLELPEAPLIPVCVDDPDKLAPEPEVEKVFAEAADAPDESEVRVPEPALKEPGTLPVERDPVLVPDRPETVTDSEAADWPEVEDAETPEFRPLDPVAVPVADAPLIVFVPANAVPDVEPVASETVTSEPEAPVEDENAVELCEPEAKELLLVGWKTMASVPFGAFCVVV